MNLDKVIAGFFIILAMTLNFGFWYGDPLDMNMHSKYVLFATIVVNLIASVLKLGDKTQIGSVLIATSLVAVLQLLAAATIWTIFSNETTVIDAPHFGVIISLSAGALLANVTSVVLYVGDTLKSKR